MDFIVGPYIELLHAYRKSGFHFHPFSAWMQTGNNPDSILTKKCVILRHDVDLLPYNSLRFAGIQSGMGIKGSYYFRAVPQTWDEAVIREIAASGHEVGYHYESLTTCNGNLPAAWDDFRRNLDRLRRLVPVTTIVMHGSPRSKHDSRDLWKRYDYRSLGIIGEPYFDLDFNKVFYITDTGRCWDGERFSVRDKPMKQVEGLRFKIEGLREQWPSYHSTHDIIRAVEAGTFPKTTMMTFHPQRWHDNMLDWSKELVMQNSKNLIKRWFFVNK